MLAKTLIKILRCPYNRNHRLNRVSHGFFCAKCGKEFKSIFIGKVEIPNFLIEKNNWIRGYHGLGSKLIRYFQKETPVEPYSKVDKIVLDIGCGENTRGNLNIDCYIPNNLPQNFILANAEHLPLNNNSIDTVLSYYIIEHLINPAIFIRNVYEIAKNRVEIATDNSEWFGDVIFRIIGSGRIFHGEHNYKWSKEYMENLLRRIGVKGARVELLNLSSTPIVKFISKLGVFPKVGNFFYRDLKIVIKK